MAEFLPRKLVGIFAHPDDEAFGPGGTLALYAEKLPVHLICVTDGDGGGNRELGLARRIEIEEAAKVLGIREVEFLGEHDGSLCHNSYHRIAALLQERLSDLRPDTVMTFDPNGVSGHLDHVAVSLIVSYLFEKLEFLENLMYFCHDTSAKEVLGDYFIYVPPGYRDSDIDLQVDSSKVYAQKLAAMRKHVSQQADCDWIIDKFGDRLKLDSFRIIRKKI